MKEGRILPEKSTKKLVANKAVVLSSLLLTLSLASACGNATINAKRVFIEGESIPNGAMENKTSKSSQASDGSKKPQIIVNNYYLNEQEKSSQEKTVVVSESKPVEIDWSKQLTSSELYMPDYGTTIESIVAPNQIAVISGGPMTVDYIDQGVQRTLSFPGGVDRGTLIFFVGNGQFSRQIGVKGVVPKNNWVGKYSVPDLKPTNPETCNSLIRAKIAETFGFGGIPGGTKYVDVVVIGANGQLIHQSTYYRGY